MHIDNLPSELKIEIFKLLAIPEEPKPNEGLKIPLGCFRLSRVSKSFHEIFRTHFPPLSIPHVYVPKDFNKREYKWMLAFLAVVNATRNTGPNGSHVDTLKTSEIVSIVRQFNGELSSMMMSLGYFGDPICNTSELFLCIDKNELYMQCFVFWSIVRLSRTKWTDMKLPDEDLKGALFELLGIDEVPTEDDELECMWGLGVRGAICGAVGIRDNFARYPIDQLDREAPAFWMRIVLWGVDKKEKRRFFPYADELYFPNPDDETNWYDDFWGNVDLEEDE